MAQQDIRRTAEKTADKAEKLVDKAADAAEDAAKNLREKVEDVASQSAEAIENARRRGAEAIETAKQGAADMAANLRDEAGRLYHKGERRAAKLGNQAAQEAEVYYDEVSDMVRRQPVAALGIAAGVGFLFGLLIARR